MSKFCEECGRPVAEGARFCTGCGANAAEAHAQPMVAPDAGPAPPPDEESRGIAISRPLAAVIALAFIALVTALAYLLAFRGEAESVSQSPLAIAERSDEPSAEPVESSAPDPAPVAQWALTSTRLTDCDETGFDISGIVAGPNNAYIRQFYEGRVTMMLLSRFDPACCGLALAFVLPNGSGRDEPAFPHCRAVYGYADIDIVNARTSYDPARGLTISVPAQMTGANGSTTHDSPIVVTINMAEGTIREGR